MAMPVITEAEHRQFACLHLLEHISEDDIKRMHVDGERDYKFRCVKCGKFLKNINGVVIPKGAQ